MLQGTLTAFASVGEVYLVRALKISAEKPENEIRTENETLSRHPVQIKHSGLPLPSVVAFVSGVSWTAQDHDRLGARHHLSAIDVFGTSHAENESLEAESSS